MLRLSIQGGSDTGDPQSLTKYLGMYIQFKWEQLLNVPAISICPKISQYRIDSYQGLTLSGKHLY